MKFNTDIFHSTSESSSLAVHLHALCESFCLIDELKFPDYRKITSKNTSLLRYEARGHGKSDGTKNPKDYSWSSLASDLDAVLLENKDNFSESIRKNLFLIGSSLGTGTILNFIAHPESRESLKYYNVTALVLSLPPTCWETRNTDYFDTIADKIRDLGIEKYVEFLRSLKPTVFTKREFPEAREISLKHTLKMNPVFYEAMIRGAKISDLPDKELIKKINLPTLILGRIDDPTLHPVKSCELLNSLIPNSEVFISKNATDIYSTIEKITEFIERNS